MTNDNWKTIRVPPDAWERAQEQRTSAGRTWGEQIVRPDGDETPEEDLSKVLDLIERIPERTADKIMERHR